MHCVAPRCARMLASPWAVPCGPPATACAALLARQRECAHQYRSNTVWFCQTTQLCYMPDLGKCLCAPQQSRIMMHPCSIRMNLHVFLLTKLNEADAGDLKCLQQAPTRRAAPSVRSAPIWGLIVRQRLKADLLGSSLPTQSQAPRSNLRHFLRCVHR